MADFLIVLGVFLGIEVLTRLINSSERARVEEHNRRFPEAYIDPNYGYVYDPDDYALRDPVYSLPLDPDHDVERDHKYNLPIDPDHDVQRDMTYNMPVDPDE